MRVVAEEAAASYIREQGGTLWVWIDPHPGLGGVHTVYLIASVGPPGTRRETRRIRSSRLSHKWKTFEEDGFRVKCSFGRYGLPDELHLVRKGSKRKGRVEAFWNGAIFVGEDVPPPSSS